LEITLKNTSPGTVLKIYFVLFILLLFPPLNSHALKSVYTVQTGSFDSAEAAQKQFDSIVQELNEKDLDYLRIEKIGEFYSVRLGKFTGYSIAEKLVQAIKPKFSKAFTIEAYIKDERIVRSYKRPSVSDDPIVTEESLPVPVEGNIEEPVPNETDAIKEKERLAAAHEKKGDMHANNNSYILAIEEYRLAIKQGANYPDLHWKLALLLYQAGFVEEAVIEMEKAVALSPDTDGLRIDLGRLYLAGGGLETAKEQFFAALEINPGHATVYYYLGELFLRTGEYDMAWLSVNMAKRLGHTGQDLIRKLSALSKEPDRYPRTEGGEDLYIRQILVRTYEEALSILKQISEGELFEFLAMKESIGPNAERGGYMGKVKPSELHHRIAGKLLTEEVLAEPVIIETGNGFHIVQRIMPFDLNEWKKILADNGRINY
jgi:peptidyl-prolyl cis-trans isomerase C